MIFSLACWSAFLFDLFFYSLLENSFRRDGLFWVFYLFSVSIYFAYRLVCGLGFSGLMLLGVNTKVKSSSHPILSFSFILSILTNKSLLNAETFLGTVRGTLLIFLQRSASECPTQGEVPVSISYKITPIDQISDLVVYSVLFRICGDMYMGVPTIVLNSLLS